MLDIKKTYVTDENKRPIAVQIDIKTFLKELSSIQQKDKIRIEKLVFENNTLTFERLIHRKDIYKYYP